MQDPEFTQPSKWKPTQAVVGGAAIGGAIGQIIVAVCNGYFQHPLGPEVAGAINTLAVGVITYLIPDSTRS